MNLSIVTDRRHSANDHANHEALFAAVDGLSGEDRALVQAYLLGHVASVVKPEHWQAGIDSALRWLKEARS